MVTAWVLRLGDRLPIISTAVIDASKSSASRLPPRAVAPAPAFMSGVSPTSEVRVEQSGCDQFSGALWWRDPPATRALRAGWARSTRSSSSSDGPDGTALATAMRHEGWHIASCPSDRMTKGEAVAEEGGGGTEGLKDGGRDNEGGRWLRRVWEDRPEEACRSPSSWQSPGGSTATPRPAISVGARSK
jgi:hypothetical protein